jgi:parallel beta-helix repeat protein
MSDLSQPGVFNVLDYGMSSTASASYNTAALQAAIDAAQASSNPNGAIVLIPSFDDASPPNYGIYQIEPSMSGPAITIPASSSYSASPLLICGTGIGTTLRMNYPGGDLFLVESSAFVTFQDLTIEYVIVDGIGGQGTAFNFSAAGSGKSEGYKLFRVNVLDCETAVNLGNLVAGTVILQCNISYSEIYPANPSQAVTGVSSSGAQMIIDQCVFSCAETDEMGFNTSSTAISIGGSADARVTNSQISGFGYGILLEGQSDQDVKNASFSGLVIDATVACIAVQDWTYDCDFMNCSCSPTPGASLPSYSPIGILLQSSSGHPIDTIRFTACSASGFPQYGAQVTAGQNIQINGGHYSGNGSAGIAITAAVSEIQIEGANCIGPLYAGSTDATLQQYGIYITAGTDIQLIGVHCSGNGTSTDSPNGIGINIDGAATDIRIAGAICNGPVLGSSSGITQAYGISVNGATGVVIDGCSALGNAQYGIYLTAVNDVTVSNCDLFYESAAASTGGIALNGSSPGSSNIFVRGCNISGFSGFSDAVNASTPGGLSKVEVTNCAGYNDLAVRLRFTSPGAGVMFNGVTYGYYGPTAFYINTTGIVSIDGYSTNLKSGSYVLHPGEYAEVASGSVISTFLMIGN